MQWTLPKFPVWRINLGGTRMKIRGLQWMSKQGVVDLWIRVLAMEMGRRGRTEDTLQ